MDPHIGDLPNGDIHVRDGLIVNVGYKLKSPSFLEIDGCGMIALPGFVATHRHLLSEAVTHDEAPIDLSDAEAADIYCVLRFAMLEALSEGITCLHHCAYDLDAVFAEIAIMAQLDVGLHGLFSYPIELGSPDAQLPGAAAELAQRWCSNLDHALLAFGLACSASDVSALRDLAPLWPITAEHNPIAPRVIEGRTSHAAKALGLQDYVGSLTPGKQADLILVAISDSLNPEQAMQLTSNPPSEAVRLVSINGRLRKRNGVLTEPNEGLIRREGCEAGARLRATTRARDGYAAARSLLQ